MKLPLKFRRKRRLVGIDVGTATTKIVVLEKYNKEITVLDTVVINNREEDLFTEQEISGRIAAILETDNFSDEEAILGLPHHYGLTQLVDFPPGSEKHLDELVEVLFAAGREINQLGQPVVMGQAENRLFVGEIVSFENRRDTARDFLLGKQVLFTVVDDHGVEDSDFLVILLQHHDFGRGGSDIDTDKPAFASKFQW